MANWESKTLADTGFLAEMAESGEKAITSVQTVLSIVQAGGEVAKLFLTGVANPAALAASLLADAIITQLRSYRESGWFFLYVDPTDAAYGMKTEGGNFGFEMLLDDKGRVLFNKSVVVNQDVGRLYGESFEVGDQYQRTLRLHLLGNYLDKMGRDRHHEDFIPPTPRLVSPPKLVAGGYDPATWTGDMQPWDYLPIFDAKKCRTIMAEAFDDEGDIPRFEIIDKNQTLFEKGGNRPFTKSGGQLSEFNPDSIFKFPLYESGDTSLSISERKLLTKQISAGKPNYAGDTSLTGKSVFGLAIIVAAQNPDDFTNSIENVGKLFGGEMKSDMGKLKKAFTNLITPEERKITISVDTKYGQFAVDDLIMGDDSGAVGKITAVGKTTPTKMSRSYTIPISQGPPTFSVVGYKVVEDTSERATNSDERIQDTEITFVPLGPGQLKNFLPREKVFQAIATTRELSADQRPPNSIIVYSIKGEEFRNSPYSPQTGGKNPPPLADLPKFGTVLGLNAIVPASTPPDWISLKADMIPGWTDMFDGLIQMANGIKGVAEDTSAFIIALIEAIDDLIEDITRLINALIQLIELLTTGIPNAGIWMLGMESSTGNDGFKSAISSGSGAPDESYKFSCGFCFVGDPAIKDLTGKDPLETVFGDILGVEFQSV